VVKTLVSFWIRLFDFRGASLSRPEKKENYGKDFSIAKSAGRKYGI
jgi:hypothetical protein